MSMVAFAFNVIENHLSMIAEINSGTDGYLFCYLSIWSILVYLLLEH